MNRFWMLLCLMLGVSACGDGMPDGADAFRVLDQLREGEAASVQGVAVEDMPLLPAPRKVIQLRHGERRLNLPVEQTRIEMFLAGRSDQRQLRVEWTTAAGAHPEQFVEGQGRSESPEPGEYAVFG